eukprot:jgi/Botrbrau1/21655/Bobra.43_1s0055.1
MNDLERGYLERKKQLEEERRTLLEQKASIANSVKLVAAGELSVESLQSSIAKQEERLRRLREKKPLQKPAADGGPKTGASRQSIPAQGGLEQAVPKKPTGSDGGQTTFGPAQSIVTPSPNQYQPPVPPTFGPPDPILGAADVASQVPRVRWSDEALNAPDVLQNPYSKGFNDGGAPAQPGRLPARQRHMQSTGSYDPQAELPAFWSTQGPGRGFPANTWSQEQNSAGFTRDGRPVSGLQRRAEATSLRGTARSSLQSNPSYMPPEALGGSLRGPGATMRRGDTVMALGETTSRAGQGMLRSQIGSPWDEPVTRPQGPEGVTGLGPVPLPPVLLDMRQQLQVWAANMLMEVREA